MYPTTVLTVLSIAILSLWLITDGVGIQVHDVGRLLSKVMGLPKDDAL